MRNIRTASSWYLLTLLAFGLILAPDKARAEATRMTYPNAFGGELFGRGMLYNFFFDRVINDDLVAGAGFGTVTAQAPGGIDVGKTADLIPVYVNYYFTHDAGSLFATAGATLVANSGVVQGLVSSLGDLTFPSSSVIPTFGVGYENRSDNGFLFRLTGYGMVGTTFKPWFGFSLGFCF